MTNQCHCHDKQDHTDNKKYNTNPSYIIIQNIGKILLINDIFDYIIVSDDFSITAILSALA